LIAGGGQNGAKGGDVHIMPGGVVAGSGGTAGVIKLGSPTAEGFHGLLTASSTVSGWGFTNPLPGHASSTITRTLSESGGSFAVPGYELCSEKDFIVVHPTFGHTIAGQAVSMQARIISVTNCEAEITITNLGSTATSSHLDAAAMATFMIIQRAGVP
jgi:hypothetical protein